jgi:hypothetical protein
MKSKKKLLIVTLFTSFIGLSCLDQVEVPLRKTIQQLVVEGAFTNEPDENFLKLSFTSPVSAFNSVEPVQGAFVELRGSNGENVVYRAAPDGIGLYRPDNQLLRAKEGVEYLLFIRLLNGKEFISTPQKLPKTVPIQKLSARFSTEGQLGYQVFMDYQDPKDTENYYRWEAEGYHVRLSKGIPVGYGGSLCCNRCNVFVKDQNINIFSDAGTNGSTVRLRPVFFSQVYAIGRNYVEVKQFAISRETYQFWRKYNEQRQRTGTIFDPLPAPVLGNVQNVKDANEIALGFFEIAAVGKSKMTILSDTLSKYSTTFSNPLYIADGDCMLKYRDASYADQAPRGW